MQLNTLAYVSKENRITPTPITERCKRVLFRQSKCNVCVDVCPVNAISLPFGPEISEACINCGLCQISCPTEALEGAQDSDQILGELLRDHADLVDNDQTFHVHCHLAEAQAKHSVVVNCVGNMTVNTLLTLAGADVQSCRVTTGQCRDCQLKQGMALFNEATTAYTRLSNMLSARAIPITIRESVKPEMSKSSLGTSRREFLRSVGNKAARQAARVVVEKEKQIKMLLRNDNEATVQKRPSPRRETLKTLLRENYDNSLDVPVGEDLGLRKMRVEVAHCVGCGICVNVCPVGALTKAVDKYEITRTINFSLCTNCGVCTEACPQGVIEFQQPYSLNDLINDSEEVVAKVSINACLICGEIIPVSEGEICTTCQKRQVVPMFM